MDWEKKKTTTEEETEKKVTWIIINSQYLFSSLLIGRHLLEDQSTIFFYSDCKPEINFFLFGENKNNRTPIFGNHQFEEKNKTKIPRSHTYIYTGCP